MTAAPVLLVDAALDRYIALRLAYQEQKGLARLLPFEFSARALAAVATIDTPAMSYALQDYRIAQARHGATRYVIGCHTYGERARWRILARPDDDPRAIADARRAQLVHVANDSARRFARDVRREIVPGLHTNKAIDRQIAAVARMHETSLVAQLEMIRELLGNGAD